MLTLNLSETALIIHLSPLNIQPTLFIFHYKGRANICMKAKRAISFK